MLRDRFPESPPASGERSAQNQVRNPASPLVFFVQPGKTASAPRVQPHWTVGFRRTNFLTNISAAILRRRSIRCRSGTTRVRVFCPKGTSRDQRTRSCFFGRGEAGHRRPETERPKRI